MATNDSAATAALVRAERDTLLSSWRTQVCAMPCARHLDAPTLDDHMPALIEELALALERDSDESIVDLIEAQSPTAHGLQRVRDGFDIEEVVAEYNILRGCVYTAADERGVDVRGRPCHIINRVFDRAIAVALQTHSTQRALEVQQRREEYLAFVAHDLRTPLNAISLAARVLELKMPAGDGGIASMFRALRRNVQNLEALVAKVLEENTNLETELGVKVERREFDLWPLVESLTHDLRPVAGTDSTKLLNEVPDDLVVYADASLLRRVLQNLIANAIRYTPRGEVTIGARQLADGQGTECRVSDNGSGIAPDFVARVFEKGESDPDATGGSGLGLAIVKTFIEAMGGTIEVESREGAGSTFRFVLPTRAAAAAAAR